MYRIAVIFEALNVHAQTNGFYFPSIEVQMTTPLQ